MRKLKIDTVCKTYRFSVEFHCTQKRRRSQTQNLILRITEGDFRLRLTGIIAADLKRAGVQCLKQIDGDPLSGFHHSKLRRDRQSLRSLGPAAVVAAEGRSESPFDLVIGILFESATGQRRRIGMDPVGTIRSPGAEQRIVERSFKRIGKKHIISQLQKPQTVTHPGHGHAGFSEGTAVAPGLPERAAVPEFTENVLGSAAAGNEDLVFQDSFAVADGNITVFLILFQHGKLCESLETAGHLVGFSIAEGSRNDTEGAAFKHISETGTAAGNDILRKFTVSGIGGQTPERNSCPQDT